MSLQGVKTELEIEFESTGDAEVILKSIEPEIKTSPSDKSFTRADLKNNILTIEIDADDTTTLRAALNSYLRWIALSYDILKIER
jgi:KEOPS complex subunit Pcc1